MPRVGIVISKVNEIGQREEVERHYLDQDVKYEISRSRHLKVHKWDMGSYLERVYRGKKLLQDCREEEPNH